MSLLIALLLSVPAPMTTVVFVRHAEKAKAPPGDPPLTQAGQARAEALARMFKAAKPRHLFSSNYARTRQTLAPLAKATGLKVEIYDAGKSVDFAKGLKEMGGLVIVSGHSNTVPAMVQELTGQKRPLGHDDYDRIFVVSISPADATLTELRFP